MFASTSVASKVSITGYASCEFIYYTLANTSDRAPSRVDLDHFVHLSHSAGGYYKRAKAALLGMQAIQESFTVEVVEHADAGAFASWWGTFSETLGPRAKAHETSPAVWLDGKDVSLLQLQPCFRT